MKLHQNTSKDSFGPFSKTTHKIIYWNETFTCQQPYNTNVVYRVSLKFVKGIENNYATK